MSRYTMKLSYVLFLYLKVLTLRSYSGIVLTSEPVIFQRCFVDGSVSAHTPYRIINYGQEVGALDLCALACMQTSGCHSVSIDSTQNRCDLYEHNLCQMLPAGSLQVYALVSNST